MKILKSLIIGTLVMGLAFTAVAEDKFNYQSNAATKTRNVANDVGFIIFTAPSGTNTTINFPKTTSRLVISNTDANPIYVNFNGPIAKYITGTTGFTTAGSNTLKSQTQNFENLGVQVGDFITMDEGDANDGLYYVVAISGGNITLNRTTTVTAPGDQDFIIGDCDVPASTSKVIYDIGTQQIGLLSVGGTSNVKIDVYYQRDN